MRDEESMWIIVVDVTAVHAVFPGVFLRLTLQKRFPTARLSGNL